MSEAREVERSSCSLSKKSLEICIDSLGSETGSEGFSHPSSKTRTQKKKQNQNQQEKLQVIANYNYSAVARATKKPRTFPPPFPSLLTHSHRERGRLVLEAWSFPPNNFFQTQRQDGHLLLTLLNNQEPKYHNQETLLIIDPEKNSVFDRFRQEKEGNGIVAKTLPPQSPAAAVSANGFEYSWGIKSEVESLMNPFLKNQV